MYYILQPGLILEHIQLTSHRLPDPVSIHTFIPTVSMLRVVPTVLMLKVVPTVAIHTIVPKPLTFLLLMI